MNIKVETYNSLRFIERLGFDFVSPLLPFTFFKNLLPIETSFHRVLKLP